MEYNSKNRTIPKALNNSVSSCCQWQNHEKICFFLLTDQIFFINDNLKKQHSIQTYSKSLFLEIKIPQKCLLKLEWGI